MAGRVTVTKTYKLFIGGAFLRSESGRTVRLTDHKGTFMANVALSSRKDARNAAVAARKGQVAWAAATPYNRGQVLYRVAEMTEARRGELVQVVRDASGTSAPQASREVDLAVDRLVHYAGWTDKLAALVGGANAVSAPFFSYSAPEPTGVVAAVAPSTPALLGLVSLLAPALAGGNAMVIVTDLQTACVALTVAEILATSDVPAGVLNILTGNVAEVMPHLATHGDVNALDLTGADRELWDELERLAAGTVKRVYVPRGCPDFEAPAGTARMRAFLEVKTVWHPTGAPSLTTRTAY